MKESELALRNEVSVLNEGLSNMEKLLAASKATIAQFEAEKSSQQTTLKDKSSTPDGVYSVAL